MSRKVDWFRVGVMAALAALVIAVSMIFGKSWIGLAHSQEVPRVTLPTALEGMDRMTYVMPLDKGHPLCWADGNTPTTPRTIRFFRYRVEGGPKQLYLDLPWALWVAQSVATNYCTSGTHKVPKAGHWIYEAEICWLPVASDGGNCSTRVSAACAAGSTPECAGGVGSEPRGWWVYAYLPAPSGPVVN